MQIILSIIQAITELLPISSSAHLIVISDLLNKPIDQLTLTYLHFWTALAITIYYFKTLLNLIKTKEGILKLLTIGVATIPGALAGLLFDDLFEKYFYSVIFIGINSFIWGIIMILIDKKIKKNKLENLKLLLISKLQGLNDFWKMIITGCMQTLALFPGTSRSGVTTITGLILGKDIKESLDSAFLLGIPITLGPFIIELIKEPTLTKGFLNIDTLITGAITLSLGILSLYFLNYIRNKNLFKWFGWYRVGFGLALIVVSCKL